MFTRCICFITIFFLSACSTSEKVDNRTVFEIYTGAKKDFPNHELALGGWDVRSQGEVKLVLDGPRPGKFGLGWGASIQEAEKTAIKRCEDMNGSGECYIYVSGNRRVRFENRKKWLANNSNAREQIALEKKLAKKLNTATVNPSTSVIRAPSQTAPTARDYDAAQQLFGIANDALNYAVPKPNRSLNCITTSTGYLTGGLVTNCY